MSAGLKLAAGFAIGSTLTLLIHPGSRSLMLYSLQRDRTGIVTHNNPLCREPERLPQPSNSAGATQEELFLTAHLVARRMVENPTLYVRGEQYETTERFFLDAESRDPDNAYWPQLAAALAVRGGKYEDAAKAWQRASRKTRWDDGMPNHFLRLWDDLESVEGTRMAWQGLWALRFRSEAPERLFIQTGKAIYMDENSPLPELESRATILLNAGLMRDGARSLLAGRYATKLTFHAAEIESGATSLTNPGEGEQLQARFVQRVRMQSGKVLADKVELELRRTEAWLSLLRSEQQINAERAGVTFQSVLTAALPSSLLWAAAIMLALSLSGQIIAAAFGWIPHPDSRVLYALGVIAGAIVYVKTSTWMLAVWCVVLGIVLGLPVETAKPSPVRWSPLNKLVLAILAVIGFALLAGSLVWSAPSAQLLGPDSAVGSTAGIWAGLAFLVLSLSIPCARGWARLGRRPALLMTGRALSWIGTFGALFGVFSAVVVTPVALYLDSSNQEVVKSWVQNEPQAFQHSQ